MKDSTSNKTTYVDVQPRKVELHLASTRRTGLTLDEQPRSTPYTEESIISIKRDLGPVSTQTMDGKTYEFVSWSDGGDPNHTITTPTADTTYTATFREIASTTPTSLQLKPTADAYGNAAAKATNYGTSASLCSRGGTTAPATSYLRFELPEAPPGKTLTGATLRYRTTNLSSAGSNATQTVTLADDNWTETTLTWNNRPTLRQSLGTMSAGTLPNNVYTTNLSTTALNTQLGTTTTIAISGNGDDNTWLWSRNHPNPSYQPELTLTFG